MSVKQQQDSFLDRQKQKETERKAMDAYSKGERMLTQALQYAVQHNFLQIKISTHPTVSTKQKTAQINPLEELTNLYSSAIDYYSQAIQFQLTKISYYFARAKTYFICQEYHRYVFDLSIALHIDEENYALYVARSHGFYKLKKLKEAILDLDFAINKALFLQEEFRTLRKVPVGPGELPHDIIQISNQTLADLYYRRGVCKYDLRNWSESIEDFSKCVELSENFGLAYSRRGAAYLKSGPTKDGNKSIADLRKAVQSASQNNSMHLRYYKLGQALLETGNNHSAVESFSSAIESASQFLQEKKSNRRKKSKQIDTKSLQKQVILNWYQNQKFRIMEFDAPETTELFDEQFENQDEEIVEKESFPEFYAARGKAKALLGYHIEALQDFSTSISLENNNAQTYFERSAAFRIMGQYDKALQDVEFCARRKLNSDVAYNKAIILENMGQIDKALIMYESILKSVFHRQFTQQFLSEFAENCSVIDSVIMQSNSNEQFQTEKITFPHIQSLYHCALLHRQKLNFPRAIQLIQEAIQIDKLDERYHDLLSMLYHDTLNFDLAISSSETSIKLQQSQQTGVNWESFYIKAVCEMQKRNYNQALSDLVNAQQRPGGGMREKIMAAKKVDCDKVYGLLAWLPPGSPLATAYHIAGGVDAIPKDPLSPSSAARGNDGNQLVFPLLDLFGALPGQYNTFIMKKKAECLFYLEDYVGCVRGISKMLEEFDFQSETRNGKRKITQTQVLVRSNQPIRVPHDDQIVESDWLSNMLTVDLNSEERELLYQLYFLRARALTQLNRFPHALKDCGKAHFVVVSGQKYRQKVCQGVGNLLFFMSKIYAYLRLYNKSYHCSRDCLISGIPYFAVHRAYYMQGVALIYANRLELATKCLTLALRTHFTARMASYINERINQTGVISLPSLEEISLFLTANPQDISNLQLNIPKIQENQLAEGTDLFTYKIFSDLHKTSKKSELPDDPKQALQQLVPRIQQLENQVTQASFNNLKFQIKPFDDFLLMQNKDFQPPSALPNQLLSLISTPRVWACQQNAFYLHERAKAFQKLNLHELACDDFTILIRLDPNNPRLYYARAFSLNKLGLFEFAAIDFMKSRQLDPQNPLFQIDFERISSQIVEIASPGNEEFYVPPMSQIKEFIGTERRKFDAFYDVFKEVEDVCDRREWIYYKSSEVMKLVSGIEGRVENGGQGQSESSSVSEDENEENESDDKETE
ncbi:Tetratricopeptide repeat protein [Spironucleus salmonicida]|uniref:Tetratricopeptide repeat protein n=1 Tax=Spironucleus salmonicida TaxID=348837 RepID=V6LDR4_9EUKA|nr:Tetratricopeptide repeat protein [Spironucleus salmonicida]|eukprot:EST42627.1 Tetratricopeptide repeat protein [Spironucleus salmonicida]